MSDRPIIFNGPMVRALLDGRKTQTRRTVKARKDRNFGCVMQPGHIAAEVNNGEFQNCPYGQPGDLLWVRETFQPLFAEEWEEGRNPDGSGDRANYQTGEGYAPHYVADCGATEFVTPDGDLVTRCTSPIHMPRWASRLTLRITDVRVQRLQDISEADAVTEGVEPFTDFLPAGHWRRYRDGGWNGYVDSPIASYASLWTQINGDGSWEENPWVWALTFDVIKANVIKANVDQVQP